MNTGRPEHLAANAKAAPSAGWLCFGLYAALAWPGVEIAPFWMPVAAGLTAYSMCGLMEEWATPDRDLEENRKMSLAKVWWGFYGRATPHRSPFSHSLMLGLPIRFIWGFLPVWLLVLAMCPSLLLPMLWGALVSDAVHLRLDNYSLVEILVGK